MKAPLANEGRNDSREILLGPLPSFEDLLWEWIAVQERSIRLWKGKDALWWYGERTSLGGFAGAVWRSGGFVLEEYSTEKALTGSRASKRLRRTHGRGDMDFALGGWKFTIEAKHCWPELGSKNPMLSVERALKEAEEDISRVPREKDYTRLALVFASPRWIRRGSLEAQITQWVSAARRFEHCACAWVFPRAGRKLFWKRTKRIYPGAAVFIKYAGGRKQPV